MQTHELKLAPEFWAAVDSGDKKAEYRVNDRHFQKGDGIIFIRGEAENPMLQQDSMVFKITDVCAGNK